MCWLERNNANARALVWLTEKRPSTLMTGRGGERKAMVVVGKDARGKGGVEGAMQVGGEGRRRFTKC